MRLSLCSELAQAKSKEETSMAGKRGRTLQLGRIFCSGSRGAGPLKSLGSLRDRGEVLTEKTEEEERAQLGGLGGSRLGGPE